MDSITKKCVDCDNPAMIKGRCVDCFKSYRRIVSKRYADKNREEINRKARGKSKEPEEKKKNSRRAKIYRASSVHYYKYKINYSIKNRDHINEKARERIKGNRDKYLSKSRKWYSDNKERMREHHVEWREKNPLRTSIIERRSRNKRRSKIKGNFSVNEWVSLCEKYDNKCLCCGLEAKLTIDHVVPISKGGQNVIENLQPLCKSCNSKKGTKDIDYRK